MTEKEAQFEREAPTLKITGKVEAVVAVDLQNGLLFNSATHEKENKKDTAAIKFARWLLGDAGYLQAIPDRMRGSYDYEVMFLGFNLKPFFRVLGVECNTAGYRVPLGLWYGNEACLDPYEMLVESDHGGVYRDMFPLTKVLERGGLKLKTGYTPGVDPLVDTIVTMELASRFGLVPTRCQIALDRVKKNKAFSVQDPADLKDGPPQRRRRKGAR